MTRSTPASRGDTVALTIGPLLEVKVTLFNQLATDSGVSRKQFTKDGHPVGVRPYDKLTGENVEQSDIVKKIETEYGPVPVEDHEIEALFDLRPSSMTITCYQPAETLGTLYVPKQPYSVEVASETIKKKKVVPAVQLQAFHGLLKAMESLGVVAVCEVVTRGKPKPAVLLPDGTLWMVYTEEELREPRPTQEAEVPEAAIEMIKNLVVPKITNEPVVLTDTYSTAIQNYADEKGREGNFASPDAPEVDEAVLQLGSTDDLMAALAQSLAVAGAA